MYKKAIKNEQAAFYQGKILATKSSQEVFKIVKSLLTLPTAMNSPDNAQERCEQIADFFSEKNTSDI